MNALTDFNFDDQARFANVGAEQSVLGGLMLNNSAIDLIEGLKAEHFTRSEHQGLFRAITFMIQNGKQADVMTVFEVMQRKNKLDEIGGMPYLNQLVMSVSSSALIASYADIIISCSQLRTVRDAANEIHASIVTQGLTGAEAINKAAEVLANIENADTSAESASASDVAVELLDDIAKREAGVSKDVIATGFDSLDNDALDGGFERGNVIVIAGRTSMGKTAFGFNLLSNMTDDHVGLVVSLEMSKLQLARRVAASLGNIGLSDMKSGVSNMDEAAWGRLTVGIDKLGKKKFHIQERSDPTVYNICAAARKHKRKHGLDVLMVDHLGLMNHGDSKANDASKIGATTKALKNLALELNIVILLLVQINRAGAQGDAKRPTLANLRDSGRIEEDADIALLLHRDDYYRDEEEKKHDGFTHLICAKVRDGDPKTVHLKFDGKYSRFSDWVGLPPHYEPVQIKKSGRDRAAGYS